jgi:hypothetical protein
MKKLLLALSAFVLAACASSTEDLTLKPVNILLRSESNASDAVYVYNLQPFTQLGRLAPLLKGQIIRVPVNLIRNGTLSIGLANSIGQRFALPAMGVGPKDVCYDLVADQHLQFSSLEMCKK